MKTSTYQAAVLAVAYALAGTGCCGIRTGRPDRGPAPNREIVIGERVLETRVLPVEKQVPVYTVVTNIRAEFGDPLSLDYENDTIRIPLRYWKIRKITERVRANVTVEQDVINEADLFEQGPQLGFSHITERDLRDFFDSEKEREFKGRIIDSLKRQRKENPYLFKTYSYVKKKTATLERVVKQSRTAEEQGTEPLADFVEGGYQLIAMGGCIEEKPRYAPDGSFIEFSLKKGCYTGETENEARKKAERHLGYSHVQKPCRKLAKEMLKEVKLDDGGLELCLLKKGDDDCTTERKREEGYRFPIFEFPDAGYNERFIADILRQKFENRFGEVQINFYLRRRNPAMNVDIDVRRVEIKPKKVPTPEQLAAICFEDGSNPFNTARGMLAGWYEFWDKEEPAEYEDNDTIEASVFLPSTVDMRIDVGFGWPKVKKTVTFRKKEELMKFVFKER